MKFFWGLEGVDYTTDIKWKLWGGLLGSRWYIGVCKLVK